MVTILKSKLQLLKDSALSRVAKVKENVKADSNVPSKKFKLSGLFSGLQGKMMVTYLLLVAIILVLLNTYPVMLSRNLIFESIESSLVAKTYMISSAISGLENMNEESVRRVIEDLELDGNSIRGIVVSDEKGEEIYKKNDYTEEEMVETKVKNFGIGRALMGKDVFYSVMKDGSFASCTSIPVTREENIIGVVHLYEFDSNQGELILRLRANFVKFSGALAVVVIILSIVFSGTTTKRLRRVLDAIEYVREGEYSYRVAASGKDEVAQLGQEFNRLTDRLQTTEEVRRRFVSDASHELKTPLASIRLLSDSILQSDNIDQETVKEFVEDIGNEAERLARTTEKLLNLTRLDNKLVFPKELVDVKKTILSTVRMLEPIAESYSVTISSELEDGCTVFSTEDDIYQIVRNLVENAVKYNVPGGTVEVVLHKENDNIIMTVSDTGIGIPEDDLPMIFDRFYRVDKARSRASGGTGLGLSIVKSTVEDQGGTITVARRENGGTRFEVIFKLTTNE